MSSHGMSSGGLMCFPSRPADWNTSTGLGAGIARYRLAELKTAADALDAIRSLTASGMKLRVIGGGMNFVGTDSVSEETVFLKPAPGAGFSVLRFLEDGRIEAGAACSLREMIFFALEHSLGGASGLSGIPGTLGGALAMNAGAMGVSISDFVESVTVIPLDSPEERRIPAADLNFSYRSSPCLRDRVLITGAVLKFRPVEKEQERLLLRTESERRSHAPKGRSAGSVFQNPPGVSAGKLLEEAGCKGLERGAFRVSGEHANWIVRKPGEAAARASDFTALVREMRRRVMSAHSIILTPEVRFANMSDHHEFQKKPLKILVLKGGCSSEREVSLESGAAVAKALRESGFTVDEFDVKALALSPEMKEADIVWPVLHGGFGEDGRIQKMLEDAGITFVGSGSKACNLLMDKVASKKLMNKHGIPNAKHAVVKRSSPSIPAGLKFPLVVKPVSEGSTFGLSVVESPADWDRALELVFRYGETALVEEFFKGVEVTLGIVAGKPLPMIEIRYSSKVYDYDAKYTHKVCETQYLCPAPSIPKDLCDTLSAASLKFYELSGARDILRVDLMVDPATGDFCMLEGNSIPGCTANSLVPKAAKAMGLSFPELCTMLVKEAAARKECSKA